MSRIRPFRVLRRARFGPSIQPATLANSFLVDGNSNARVDPPFLVLCTPSAATARLPQRLEAEQQEQRQPIFTAHRVRPRAEREGLRYRLGTFSTTSLVFFHDCTNRSSKPTHGPKGHQRRKKCLFIHTSVRTSKYRTYHTCGWKKDVDFASKSGTRGRRTRVTEEDQEQTPHSRRLHCYCNQMLRFTQGPAAHGGLQLQ